MVLAHQNFACGANLRLSCLHSSILQDPFDFTRRDIIPLLFKPLENKARLLCTLVCEIAEGEKEFYSLQYEHLGRFIPLLKTEKMISKGLKVLYAVKPAFPVTLHDKIGTTGLSDELWATPPQCLVQSNPLVEHSTWRSIRGKMLRRVRSFSHSVMDSPQDHSSAGVSPRHCPTPEPILAEVKGNTLTNRFKFTTPVTSPDHKSQILGDLDIFTHYVRCEPRRLTLRLPNQHNSTPPLTLVSKRPEWNPKYGIFELDFGGRINRDSIKNFQFEHEGEVVSY